MASTSEEKCSPLPSIYTETPLIASYPLEQLTGLPIHLKLENVQASGSFKLRGITWLLREVLQKGHRKVVVSSGGNAGLAVAYAAHQLGLEARVVVPKTTSAETRDRLASLAARVDVHGEVWDVANEKALQLAKEHDYFYIHPFDHPTVWEGHALMVEEMKRQMKDKPRAIVASVGGGGLVCGIVQGLQQVGWSDVPVVAMETIGADCFNASVKAGKLVTLEGITSIATCLGSLEVCQKLMQHLKEHVIFSHVISDRDAVSACLRFADDHRILVEPACGAALAAVYSGIVTRLVEEGQLAGEGPVVVVVCGGSAVTLAQLLQWKEMFSL